MSQRFVSLNGLRPALIPADYPDASLKWCYLHLKARLKKLKLPCSACSDLLCYSLSWQTGQIHTRRAVINNLNLAAKEKVKRGESEGWFNEVTASFSSLYWKDQVYIWILLSSHSPHTAGPQSGVGNGPLKQLLPGRTVQTIITLAQFKPCPCLCRFMGNLIWCYTRYEKSRWMCCSSIFLHSLSNSTL